MELPDRVAIITGGGLGIGRAFSLLFAKEDAKVVVVDFVKESGTETVELMKSNGQGTFVFADPTKMEDAKQAVAKATEAYGRVDILVDNLGIQHMGTAVETSEGDWDKTLATNLKSMFLMKHAVHALARNRGTIVNIASVAGFASYRESTAYATFEAGVVSLTRTMAVDHAGDGIRVNCVCLGAVDLALHQKYLAELNPNIREDHVKRQIADHPIGRAGKPAEIAKAVLFPASSKLSYMTGATMAVDGRFLAK